MYKAAFQEQKHASITSRQDPCYDQFSYLTLANSDDGRCIESTLRNKSQNELRVESQKGYHYNPESRLHCYRATMTIDNQYDGEVVDGATNVQKRGR